MFQSMFLPSPLTIAKISRNEARCTFRSFLALNFALSVDKAFKLMTRQSKSSTCQTNVKYLKLLLQLKKIRFLFLKHTDSSNSSSKPRPISKICAINSPASILTSTLTCFRSSLTFGNSLKKWDYKNQLLQLNL